MGKISGFNFSSRASLSGAQASPMVGSPNPPRFDCPGMVMIGCAAPEVLQAPEPLQPLTLI